jgi:chromosome segregation ATPase
MVAMMDTLAIYEQFRAVLGEERAKGFAQTLGTMIEEAKNAATKEDIRLLRESLDGSSSRLDRLEQVVEKLADAQARTEARVGRLEEVVEKLAEAQVRTESRLERLEQVVERLATIVEKLVIRTDRHGGMLLELMFRDRLPSYLGLFLRRAKVLQPADLLDEIEPRLDRTEVEDFLRSDGVSQQ